MRNVWVIASLNFVGLFEPSYSFVYLVIQSVTQ